MEAHENTLVSIVVVSFKGGNMLQSCLDSIDKQDYPAVETVLVDNGSGLNLEELLAGRKGNHTCVTEKDNLGFAGGCNSGIKAAKGEIIALVNDDAVLTPGWVSAIAGFMKDTPSAGAAAGLVVDGNRRDILDSFGVGVSLDGMSRQLECGASSSISRKPKQVLAFSGCSCALRRSALGDSGLFDEAFFAYCEDTDLSLRLLSAGWEIWACPSAISYHHYSHTGGRFSLRKLYLIERNHQWVALKNFPLPLLATYPLATMWRLVLQMQAARRKESPVSGFVSNGILPVAATLIKADLAAALRIPGILAARLFQHSRRRISAFSYMNMLVQNRMHIRSVLFSGAQQCSPNNQGTAAE